MSGSEYHKIHTVYKRDPETSALLEGQYSLPELAYLAGSEWEFTEKVDGLNIRIGLTAEGRRWVGGRTDKAQLDARLLQTLEGIATVDELHSVFHLPRLIEGKAPADAVLYGEGYGARIRKGGNYRPDQAFVLFDVWVAATDASNPGTRVGGWWLQRPEVEDVAERLGLDVSPIVAGGTLLDAVELTRSGIQSRWGGFPAEGLVMRPMTELRSRAGHRIIAKIKARDFER